MSDRRPELPPDSPDTDRLLSEVYDELREVAKRSLARERSGHTLQPTALVHEVYLRLAPPEGGRWREREHLLAMASAIIRRVLVDHARAHRAAKRSGEREDPTLVEEPALWDEGALDVLALEEALERLREQHERQHRVVELRFFGGLSISEVAKVLGVSTRTVDTDWKMGRAWLARELQEGSDAE